MATFHITTLNIHVLDWLFYIAGVCTSCIPVCYCLEK